MVVPARRSRPGRAISIGLMPDFTKRHRTSPISSGCRRGRLARVTPFDEPGEWLRCALHTHTTNSDGDLAARGPRPALRLGRLRRPRDHRPLGPHRRAVDAGAARDPVGGAERDRPDPGRRRPRARPRPRGRPGRAGARVRAAAGRRLAGCSRTAACPISPTPTGAACASTSGRRARGCSGSRSGTRAASSSSAAATRRCTGTRRSSAAAASTRSRPTTRTTPATTAASRGRGCARARGRRPRCSTRCATGAFYGSTGPRIDAVEVTDGDVTVRCSPAASITLYTGRRRGARVNAGRLGYPQQRSRCSSARTTG